MAIINMGQLGEPHESSASEALRTLDTLSAVGSRVSAADTSAKNAATSATNAETRQGELSQAVATSEIRKAEMNIKNVKATHERYSLMYNDMDDQQKQIYQTSDQYKEMQKFFKGFKDIAPGMLDDQGNIVAASNKTIYADKLKENTAAAKSRIASGAGTEEDINLVKLDKLGGTEEMANALDEYSKEIKKKNLPKKDPNIFQRFMKGYFLKLQYKREANTAIDKGQRPATSDALAPDNANQADPLGILGR